MWVGVREMGRLIGPRWPEMVGAAGVLWLLGIRSRARAAEWHREQRTNEERQAYARLDVRLATDGKVLDLATRVSLVMADKSAFRKIGRAHV